MLAHLSHCLSLLQARSRVLETFFGAPCVSHLLSIIAFQSYYFFHRVETVAVFQAFTLPKKLIFDICGCMLARFKHARQ
jgi:hypothetical protein